MHTVQFKNQNRSFNQPIMKNVQTLTFILFSGLLTLGACNSNTEEKMESTMDTISQKVDNAVDSAKSNIAEYRDENFVEDVIKANTEEMHLLALATKKGTDKELKGHAKMMMADHKKMGMEMGDYAKKKGIAVDVDSSDMKSNMDDDAAGADWDRNWVDKMVSAHEDVISKFEKKEQNAGDEELKAMVSKTLPTLRSHLDMVKGLQAKMQK